MKKQLTPILQFAAILLVGAIIIISTAWIVSRFEKQKYNKEYEAGYWKGNSSCYSSYIADLKWECEDKYNWMPKEACNTDDYCKWLSKNQDYGNFYADCFDWQQLQWWKMGQELIK